jgi:phosphoglycolate phosphatase-like HAD superfamily hydrolase
MKKLIVFDLDGVLAESNTASSNLILGMPDRFDVCYGMADNRIGVARLDLPNQLPLGASADKVG